MFHISSSKCFQFFISPPSWPFVCTVRQLKDAPFHRTSTSPSPYTTVDLSFHIFPSSILRLIVSPFIQRSVPESFRSFAALLPCHFIFCFVSSSVSLPFHRLKCLAVQSFMRCCHSFSFQSSAATSTHSSVSNPIVPQSLFDSVSPFFCPTVPSSACHFTFLALRPNARYINCNLKRRNTSLLF